MRRLLTLLLLLFVVTGHAQDDRPPDLEPLPEPPAPPPGVADEEVGEPEVTIQQRGEDTYEEYRLNGQLYMIRVTPRNGVPYYLVDPAGTGNFARQDGLGADIRPPMWVIKRF
ncbi:MAG: DUF2782 domain-containing protein [Burkholderiales bacterium]|jgi:hypothetical protein|nr:DUF2782 domain-containing protein [Burkholderiales bacterium]